MYVWAYVENMKYHNPRFIYYALGPLSYTEGESYNIQIIHSLKTLPFHIYTYRANVYLRSIKTINLLCRFSIITTLLAVLLSSSTSGIFHYQTFIINVARFLDSLKKAYYQKFPPCVRSWDIDKTYKRWCNTT